jgi:hypothetical protein
MPNPALLHQIKNITHCIYDGYSRVQVMKTLFEGKFSGKGIAGEKMVAGDGIEPPTRGFSIPCSTD